LGIHNMAFYHRLMREMRESILRDDFLSFYEKKRLELTQVDGENPVRPPKPGKTSPPARLGNYEIHRSVQGFFSIRHLSSGEVMHSVNPPMDEANKLYVEQSSLAFRLSQRDVQQSELVIWDVGLGAASNPMAAVHCFERCYAESDNSTLRPLRLVSFERDLDSLTLATRHLRCFPHLRHRAPHQILANGQWKHESGLLQWELLKGDFSDLMEAAAIPDLIFYDPFSPKTDPALWTSQIFARILNYCRPKSAELYTYSASTAVRVALLTAGFFVAAGVGTGPKSDTTIAFTSTTRAGGHPQSPRLLDQDWLARWRRSGSKFPPTLAVEEKLHLERLIETHQQFLVE
jgi:queuine tRNA-ribosyltransferase